MYTNIFLKRYSDMRNDFRSEKNLRKLINFNPDYDPENEEDEAE